MQDHINPDRRMSRWNVDEAKPDSVSFQVDREWPVEIAVAIPTHNGDRRPEGLDRLENCGRADVAEMPDLIRVRSYRLELRRQLIVGIGEDEDPKRSGHFGFSHNEHNGS
jgi:hypothetical protein